MIRRREFLSVCSALGLAGVGCRPTATRVFEDLSKSEKSVIIIGAGVAGMSVGHLLAQQGVNFTILEAAPSYGGRVKTNHDFVDFPIPLGGEWLPVNEDILTKIVNDKSVDVDTEIAPYTPECIYGHVENGTFQEEPAGSSTDLEDKKFVNGTWLTFFEKFVLPGIKERIQFGTQIISVDYSNERVSLKSANRTSFSADAVVITVPPQVIKDRVIAFNPPFPKQKQKAFEDAYIWGGMKIFIEFKERFYPTWLEIAGTNNDQGEKLFYDAAYGQKSDTNVLGIFLVGDQAKPYQSRRGDELRDYVLSELDEIFDGAATRSYIKHITQNWNEEPFIRQAYFASSGNWRLPPRMRKSIAGKLFFAGDTYTNGLDWGSAHTAALSARDAAKELLGSLVSVGSRSAATRIRRQGEPVA